MPISSGATGRVDIGVDTSISWTPDGLRRDGKPAYRSQDSYLKRYLETHQLGSNPANKNALGRPAESHGAHTGVDQPPNVGDLQHESKPAGEHNSKTSKTCVLL